MFWKITKNGLILSINPTPSVHWEFQNMAARYYSYHSDTPKAGDYSEEYQALYHEHMAKSLKNALAVGYAYLEYV